MAVHMVAVGVRMAVTVATAGSARRRGERLRAPESGWEVTVRPVIGVRVDMAPMAMGGSRTAGGVHGWQSTRRREGPHLLSRVCNALNRPAAHSRVGRD